MSATRDDLLQTNKFKCSVSSVLNKDVKQHGKQFMFDSAEDTSWSSNEGTPQTIAIQFEQPVALNAFSFQFQGGFVGKNARILMETTGGETRDEAFYPEDINAVQDFKLVKPVGEPIVTKVKFVFTASTDFFGRIIVYQLKLY